MLKKALATLALGSALFAGPLLAADYVIDKQGQHAFINFKISHLGYSWLYGTFKDFSGTFTFDEKAPDASKVQVSINVSVRPTHLPDPRVKGDGVHLFKWTPFLALVSGSPCANETLIQNPSKHRLFRNACNLAHR